MESKIIPFQKIKWSIILKSSDKFGIFAQTIDKLVNSVDPKRTEIFLLQEKENKLILDIFQTVCEKANISYNYVDSNEHGFNLAKGQYVVFLTDHTLVTKNFLIKLTFAAENYGQDHKVAIVSPISNESFPDLGLTPENVEGVQSRISKQPKQVLPWTFTLKLSPFCLMIRKDVYPEQLPPVDNHLILEAIYNGYYTVLASDTIVYHFQEDLNFNVGYSFFTDPALKPQQKLAVLYRIKIDTDFIRDIFIKSLEKSSEFADAIYVLDANSKIKVSLYLREKYPDLWTKVTKYQKFSRPFDERQDYNDLLSWAETDECDWAFVLEADEIVEDKVTKDYLNKFLVPTNPEVLAYRVNHYHFYDSETMWRIDNPWGKMSDTRIVRLLHNRRITKPGVLAFQAGYTPNVPEECIRMSGIRIKNYGYVHAEDRLEKQTFYNSLNLKIDGKVPNLAYLTNQNGMHRYEFKENTTVTFYTPTNRNDMILYSWLDKNAYLADEVVIGNDTNQLTDETLGLCKSYPNVKVIDCVMGDNYGEGRNTCLKACTSDYIMQLDVDEQLDDLAGIRRLVDVPQFDVWLFSIPNIQPQGGQITTETMRLFRNVEGVQYWGRLHETIDIYVQKSGARVSRSPIKLVNYGYTLNTPDEAFKKMQRYLKINLQQMKDNPQHGMAYYSIALHMLEDDLVDDAIKLLEICNFFMPHFALAGIELGKTYIRKASQWVDRSIKVLGPNHHISNAFKQTQDALHSLQPNNYTVAKGHCLHYFNVNPKEADWLREHILKMDKQIELMKTKQLEKMKNT